MKIVMFGCGFLASHILPHILPFVDEIVLVDKDRIEKENYENGLFLKDYVGKFKTTNLSMLTRLLSNIPIEVHQKEIKKMSDLTDSSLLTADIGIVTFDNPIARKLVKDGIPYPCLNVGVTENYFLVNWLENVTIDYSDDILEYMDKVKDVCERKEFRSLGMLASSFAVHAFYLHVSTGKKYSYYTGLKDNHVQIIYE